MPTTSSRRSASVQPRGGLVALSVGRELDPWTARTGVVHSVFRRAVNLLVGGELWSVFGAAQTDAPFGIRLAECQDCGGLDLRPGDRVHVRAGSVGMGPLAIDCRAASRWAPRPWRASAVGLGARLATVEQAAQVRAWAESACLARQVTAALAGGDAELGRAVRRCVGLGPGMTPAGDDVLVGLLTVFSSGAAGAEGARSTARLAGALAPVLASTPDVSRHLLTQAARGLPSRALHELGAALIEGAADPVLEAALQGVLGIGGSSGADACMGMIAACRFSFLTAERYVA
jgi:hypothetical protein